MLSYHNLPLQAGEKVYAAKSFGAFSKKHPLRRLAFALVTSAFFELFIISLVLLNATALAMGTTNKPGYASTYMAYVLARLDIAIIVLFTAEAVLKMIAYGVFSGPNTYFRDGEL
jgi:voltage-dependent calcium channel L type alpha-1C